MKILFVGNSFTYYNDLPAMVAELARAETDRVVKGGWYLKWYADPENEMSAPLRAAYAGSKWDAMVLQDQSFNPAGDPEGFVAASKRLRAEMPEGRLYFYQTWAYEDGSEKLASTGCDYETMRRRLREAYAVGAAECGGIAVPVGDAFGVCHDEYPQLNLYIEDHYHPSPLGTYLAACLFCAYIMGIDPMTLSTPEGVDPAAAPILREVAARFRPEAR